MISNIEPALGTPMRIVTTEYGFFFNRPGFLAYVDSIEFDNGATMDTPPTLIGRGRTVAEAQTNFWAKWLRWCIVQRRHIFLELRNGEHE